MATGIDICSKSDGTFHIEIELTADEIEHCKWEGFVGTEVNVTREQLIQFSNKINLLLGETLDIIR